MSRIKRLLLSGAIAVLIVLTVFVWARMDERIDAAKMSANQAFHQAMRDGVKTEIGGVSLYTESSIGKSDISWRLRPLEAPPHYRDNTPYKRMKKQIGSAEEALEHALYILDDGKKRGVPDEEQLMEIVHLEKDNLWMFCYWLVGYEGGVSGCVIDGNSGEYLKGWVEE